MGYDPSTSIFPRSMGSDAATPTPFSSHFNFPYLSRLMNDPVHHDPSWPPVPTKLPSDIPKFEGRLVRILVITSLLFIFGAHPIPLMMILFI
jgi:hypothetical protein